MKKRLIISGSLLVGSKIMNVLIPISFKEIIDFYSLTPDPSKVMVGSFALVAGYGFARISSSLFSELKNAIFSKITQASISQATLQVFDRLLTLDLEYHQSKKMGAITTIMDRGKRGISFILNAFVINVLPTLLELIFVCGILNYKFGFEYAFIAFFTILCYTGFTIGVTEWRTKFRKNMNRIENESSAKVMDSLMNYEVVKYFNGENIEKERYDKLLKEFEKENVKVQTSLSMLNFGQSAIFSFAMAYMMWMTMKGIDIGQHTVGDLVLINTLLFQLSIPLNFLGTLYREITQSMTDMDNMFSILKIDPKLQGGDKVFEKGTIEFQNVTFAFKDRVILKDFSFKLEAGETLGICGESGSGKSTIFKLLFRFFDPQEGKILIDGIDIKEMNIDELRRRIGVIPQETHLFHESLEYNILYGNPNSKDKLPEAMERAHLGGLIPKLSESVGDRGTKLSSGEKQRVSIARTILKNPKVLLCDEVTSALDVATENKIIETISEVSQGKTTIMIAHRLNTLQNCHKILVLGKGGNILEQGSHQELLEKNGVYSNMYNKSLYHEETK